MTTHVAPATGEPMTPAPTETDPVILRRIFPAEVTTGEQLITGALAVVTRERVYVWENTSDGIGLRLDAAYDRPEDAGPLPREYQLRFQPIVLSTDFGQVTVNAGRGCGCGNPLKGYRPFTPEMRADT